MLLLLSHFCDVRLRVTPQMAARQAPPSLGFSRQEYWSGVPSPSLRNYHAKWEKVNGQEKTIKKMVIVALPPSLPFRSLEEHFPLGHVNTYKGLGTWAALGVQHFSSDQIDA